MERVSTLGPPPNAATVRFSSPAERERRLAALREAMTREGIDALIVTGRDDARYRGRTTC